MREKGREREKREGDEQGEGGRDGYSSLPFLGKKNPVMLLVLL